jgi:hypothetical protein
MEIFNLISWLTRRLMEIDIGGTIMHKISMAEEFFSILIRWMFG